MSEKDVIDRTPRPRTRESLATDLRRLGLGAGDLVLVHSSLSALGWVAGGAEAVVQALMDVLTPEGTLLMPAQSTERTDPAGWQNPPVPAEWVQEVRDHMPPYDPATTPGRAMGQIAELFRTWPGVRRSGHPHVSFTAWGARAGEMLEPHGLDWSLGDDSPLGRIYRADGLVLLLGVGYGNNTSFHLAEYRVPSPPLEEVRAPVGRDGTTTIWVTYRDVVIDEQPFPLIGEEFEREGEVRLGMAGSAPARLFRQRPAVDFAVEWLRRRRAPIGGR